MPIKRNAAAQELPSDTVSGSEDSREHHPMQCFSFVCFLGWWLGFFLHVYISQKGKSSSERPNSGIQAWKIW